MKFKNSLIALVSLLAVACAPVFAATGTESQWQRSNFLVESITVGTDATVGQLHVGGYEGPAGVTIALAASATTDGMTITVTVVDRTGTAIAKPFPLLLWLSEAATCANVTGDTYSGTLTATTGVLLQTITAKKTFMVQTAATGVFVGTLVDSANPTDQYVCVTHPITGTPIESAVSGTNWEGI